MFTPYCYNINLLHSISFTNSWNQWSKLKNFSFLIGEIDWWMKWMKSRPLHWRNEFLQIAAQLVIGFRFGSPIIHSIQFHFNPSIINLTLFNKKRERLPSSPGAAIKQRQTAINGILEEEWNWVGVRQRAGPPAITHYSLKERQPINQQQSTHNSIPISLVKLIWCWLNKIKRINILTVLARINR